MENRQRGRWREANRRRQKNQIDRRKQRRENGQARYREQSARRQRIRRRNRDIRGQRPPRIGVWVLTVLLVVVLAAGIIGLLRHREEERRAREEAARLASIAAQTTEAQEPSTEEQETEPPYESPVNFEELSAINPDIVGWITIPDTNIDYPIVQTDDNDKYLHIGFDGEKNKAGTIFLDFESDGDFRGYNNVLYGHHMRNGSMFKDVVKFKEQEYFEAHEEGFIYTPDRTIRLRFVSAYYGDADPVKRRTQFASQEEFDQYVEEMISPCRYAKPVQAPVKSIFTLITCSYEFDDARTFLFGVEVEEPSP